MIEHKIKASCGKFNHRLYQADCLEFLRELPDNSIDLCIFDPPYHNTVTTEWDRQWETTTEYVSWCRSWAIEAARVLKPGGSAYYWGTPKDAKIYLLKFLSFDGIEGMMYCGDIIWESNWGGRSFTHFPSKHQIALAYSKGKPNFYPNNVVVPGNTKGSSMERLIGIPNSRLPLRVWKLTLHSLSVESRSKAFHATKDGEPIKVSGVTKPIAILSRIILAHTKQGDTVLDVFSGSGSTMIACDKLNRKFIGCERSKFYTEKSIERFEIMRNETVKGEIND